MSKKWEKVGELIAEFSSEDMDIRHELALPEELKCICYAPNIGWRAWLFKYKGVLVALWDQGNGWWSFYSLAGYFDVLVAKWIDFIHRRRHSWTRKKKS